MAVAAALFAGYSAYNSQNSNELTDIALANVEALAASDEANKETCGTKMEWFDDVTNCPGDNDYKTGMKGTRYSKTTGNDSEYKEGFDGIIYFCDSPSGRESKQINTYKCNENILGHLK